MHVSVIWTIIVWDKGLLSDQCQAAIGNNVDILQKDVHEKNKSLILAQHLSYKRIVAILSVPDCVNGPWNAPRSINR